MKIIYAHDLKNGIGLKNKLPWCIAEDMKFFKNKIKNKITVAGRTTFNSVPFKVSKLFTGDVDSLRKENNSFYIIGGAATYESVVPFLKSGDTIYETKIYGIFETDTTFSFSASSSFSSFSPSFSQSEKEKNEKQSKKDDWKKKIRKTIIFDGLCEEKKYGDIVRVKIMKKKII